MATALPRFRVALALMPAAILSLLFFPFPAQIFLVDGPAPVHKVQAAVVFARSPDLRVNPLDLTLLSAVIRQSRPVLRLHANVVNYALYCVNTNALGQDCDDIGSEVVYGSRRFRGELSPYEPDIERLAFMYGDAWHPVNAHTSERSAVARRVVRVSLQYFDSKRSDFAPLFFGAHGALLGLIVALVIWRRKVGAAIFSGTFGAAGTIIVKLLRSFKYGDIKTARVAAGDSIKDAAHLSKSGIKKAKQFYDDL